MLDGVLQHEIGHTVGLRHNFEASSDLFNYKDEFYSIRELDYRTCQREGPMSCVFGRKCRMFCQDDSYCMPSTTCQEVDVLCERDSDCMPHDPSNDYWALKDAEGNVTVDFKACYACSDEGLCVVREDAASECPVVSACVNQFYEPTGACWDKQTTFEECTSDGDCAALDNAVCLKKAEEIWGTSVTFTLRSTRGTDELPSLAVEVLNRRREVVARETVEVGTLEPREEKSLTVRLRRVAFDDVASCRIVE